jgi:hypothetical protein
MTKSVAIVTGASQGIGRATAVRLAKDFSAWTAGKSKAFRSGLPNPTQALSTMRLLSCNKCFERGSIGQSIVIAEC